MSDSRPRSTGRVYGAGQPIVVGSNPSNTNARDNANGGQRRTPTNNGRQIGFGGETRSMSKADYSGVGSGGVIVASSSSDGTGTTTTSSSSGGVWSLARAVGGAILHPLGSSATPAPSSSSSHPLTPSQMRNMSTSSALAATSSYDPHLSNFPLLPRFRGRKDDLELYPITFEKDGQTPSSSSSSSSSSRRTPFRSLPLRLPTTPLSSEPQYNLSSILNSPAFVSAEQEVEPSPLYITPLPSRYEEPVERIKDLIREYHLRTKVEEEFRTYVQHHGTSWQQQHTSDESHDSPDSSTIRTETFVAKQYATCLKLVPSKYFSEDFSVAQEALIFYEQQLAAAAAEADEEDELEEAKRLQQLNNGNGNGNLQVGTTNTTIVTKSPSSSSASSFYSTFAAPASTPSSSSSTLPSGAVDSTYFQAAWAATHAPSHVSAGLVPGVVGAVLITPAKAAASLYKLFNKVTGGGSGKSPTNAVVQSHQRSLPFSTMKHHKMNGSGGRHGSSPLPPTTTEELNAIQLQQRLASYLDLVELTLMQLVGSKSKAFFTSLATIPLLAEELTSCLTTVQDLRSKMFDLEERVVKTSLGIVQKQQTLKNMLRLQELLKLLSTISTTQSTIKLLLATSEFSSAIQLVHSTLALVKLPELKSLKCLSQMELKLKENLKLIDMLMMSEFNMIAILDTTTTTNSANGGGATPTSTDLFDLPPISTSEGKAALRSQVALSEEERERLNGLCHSLLSFGTLLPTILKYGSELRNEIVEELKRFVKEEFSNIIISSSAATTSSTEKNLSTTTTTPTSSNIENNPTQTTNSNQTNPTTPAPAPAQANTPTTATSSSSSSFMSSFLPTLKRTGSIISSSSSSSSSNPPSSAVGPSIPLAPPISTVGSSSATSDDTSKGTGFDFTSISSNGSSTASQQSTGQPSLLPSPSTSPAANVDSNTLDPTIQSILANMPHVKFLQLQSRLFTRICRLIYRAESVRDCVLDSIDSLSPSSASTHLTTVTPQRIRQEFRDMFRNLLCAQPSSSAASSGGGGANSRTSNMVDSDPQAGIVESRCVGFLEPRLQQHARLDLYEMKELFDSTMEFVRDMEELGVDSNVTNTSNDINDRSRTGVAVASKFVCLELRKVTLQHEKAFLSSIHSKLVNELTSAMARDSWDRVDVPRPFQVLVDSGFQLRPHGLRIIGATATRGASTRTNTKQQQAGGGVGTGTGVDGESFDDSEEDSVTAATYLFIESENEDHAIGTGEEEAASSSSSSSSFSRYPLTSSVLTLLNHISFYCECAIQLKGVSNDVLKGLTQLLTLFTSRSMQLILGAGAVATNPDVKIITSKHLALTSQCLSLIFSQLSSIKRLLQIHFPEKHHTQLLKDMSRLKQDYQDHIKEIWSKLEQMALEVCEATCKGCVQWMKREDELVVIANKQAAAMAAGSTPVGTSPVAPPTNDLPTLFKLSNRLLTQTEALYSVIAEFVQPDQKADLMTRISLGYIERFRRYFYSSTPSMNTLHTSRLTSMTTRLKFSKRIDVILEKFQIWLTKEAYLHMKQQLEIFHLHTNQIQQQQLPSTTPTATTNTATAAAPTPPTTTTTTDTVATPPTSLDQPAPSLIVSLEGDGSTATDSIPAPPASASDALTPPPPPHEPNPTQPESEPERTDTDQ